MEIAVPDWPGCHGRCYKQLMLKVKVLNRDAVTLTLESLWK